MDNTIVQIWLNVKCPHCLFWQSSHSHLEDSVDMLRYDSILSIRCVTKQRKKDKYLPPPKTDVGTKGGKSLHLCLFQNLAYYQALLFFYQ